MKKLTLISIILLCVLLAPLQAITAQETTDQFNLEIINVETDPDAIRVGEETQFIISFANSGAVPVPPNSAEIFLAVVDLNTDGNKVLEICGPKSFTDGALPIAESGSDPQKFIFPECKFTPTEEGALSVRAGFVPPGTDAEALSAAVAANNVDFPIDGNANQDSYDSITINVQPYESNLPGDLARVFAGLGIFFAIMAIVAVGTEVVIDTFKVALGFKSKVTATEGLEKMEKYMPGQLASLGVSQEQLNQFKTTTAQMRTTLRTYLKPVEDLTAARQSIQSGEFKEAYTQIISLTPAIKTAVDKKTAQGKQEAEELIADARQQMMTLVGSIFAKFSHVFKINAAKLNPLREGIESQIDAWGKDQNDVEDLNVFLDKVFEVIRDFQEIDWAAELGEQEGWLENQTDAFKHGSKQLLYHYNEQVAPLLLGIGFGTKNVAGIQDTIAERLSWIETNARQASDTYVQSVRNVINAVEQRRFQTQSPARKMWRALRSWQWGVFLPKGKKENAITITLGIVIAIAIIISIYKAITGANTEGIFAVSGLAVPFTFILLVAILLILGYRHWKNDTRKPVYGLYGVFVLSVLLALLVWFIIWVVQPSNANVRLFGELTLWEIVLPWWGWTILVFTFFFVTVIVLGEVFGSYAYAKLAATSAEAKKKWAKHTTLIKVETLFNLMHEGFDASKVDPDSFDTPHSVHYYEKQENIITNDNADDKFVLDEKTVGQFILWRTDQQRDEEASRLRWLRAISFFVGLTIAYLLNIDAIALLGEAFPGVAGFNYTILSGETLNAWKDFLNPDRALTAGIILTGFAAAAGSTFWHDRLDQLQATKKGAETAADMLKQAQEAASK